MTVQELKDEIKDNGYPPFMTVDAETYGNLCDYLIKNKLENPTTEWVEFAVGMNQGIIFQSVEIRMERQ